MILAVINQKGGVGKTTTALNLGAALAKTGARVLLLDLDAQRSLSQFEGSSGQEKEPSLAITEAAPESLREILASQSFDYALLDCPPILGQEAAAALQIADVAIAPTPARFLDVAGFALLREAVEAAQNAGNPRLKLRVLLTMRDARFAIQNEYETNLRALFGDEIFSITIPRSVVFERAADARQSVVALEPRSSGAAAYLALAQEILALNPNQKPKISAPQKHAKRPKVSSREDN